MDNQNPTLSNIIGGIIAHMVIVAFITLVAMFVFNFGLSVMLPTVFVKLHFVSTYAIMVGVYVIFTIISFHFNKYLEYKKAKMTLEIFKKGGK